jgi:hypothetical protein
MIPMKRGIGGRAVVFGNRIACALLLAGLPLGPARDIKRNDQQTLSFRTGNPRSPMGDLVQVPIPAFQP